MVLKRVCGGEGSVGDDVDAGDEGHNGGEDGDDAGDGLGSGDCVSDDGDDGGAARWWWRLLALFLVIFKSTFSSFASHGIAGGRTVTLRLITSKA